MCTGASWDLGPGFTRTSTVVHFLSLSHVQQTASLSMFKEEQIAGMVWFWAHVASTLPASLQLALQRIAIISSDDGKKVLRRAL